MARSGRKSVTSEKRRDAALVSVPRWLQVARVDAGDVAVTATCSWVPTGASTDWTVLEGSLREAWQAWEHGNWRRCRDVLGPCRDSLGSTWLPASSIDGKRCWTWLRLASLIPDALDGDRRGAVGCIELLNDLHLNENSSLAEGLLEVVLQDFTVHGSASREWGALLSLDPPMRWLG